MADQPVAPDEPFDYAGAVTTTLGGDNVRTTLTILTAPETPSGGGGGGGGTTAHGFVT